MLGVVSRYVHVFKACGLLCVFYAKRERTLSRDAIGTTTERDARRTQVIFLIPQLNDIGWGVGKQANYF
jgi:hypothetical protein